MQNRKTPTTLVWMAGILILVGGFLLVRAFSTRQGRVGGLTPTASSTLPNDTNGYSTTPNPTLPSDSTPTISYGKVTLRLGQTAQFKDLSIKVVSVVEDSRCPVDVQCIQAGTVRISLQIVRTSGTSTQTVSLGKFVTTQSEKILFESVTPEKKERITILRTDYRFTLNVSKSTSPPSTPIVGGRCYVGGCSGQLCTANPGTISTCEYNPAYGCYKTATCERQSSGQCGFTQTPELAMCLNNPPAL
ncbi:hypothetical protein BH11PAT3_BH11PAT3_0690 [soil metagenome]